MEVFAEGVENQKSLYLLIEYGCVGTMYKLYGNAVYSTLPQISSAVQHKSLESKEIAKTF